MKSIGNYGIEPPWVQPAYDAAGNLTRCPRPEDPTKSWEITYDAWNRPTVIRSAGAWTFLEYDGLGRMVEKFNSTEGVTDNRRYTYSPVLPKKSIVMLNQLEHKQKDGSE